MDPAVHRPLRLREERSEVPRRPGQPVDRRGVGGQGVGGAGRAQAAAPDRAMIHRYSVELAGAEREISVEKLDGSRVRVTHGGRARIYEAVRVAGNARASS